MTLNNSVEEIGLYAFGNCNSVQHINIPPTVKVIDDSAFSNCSSLTNLESCKNIQEFVSCEAMQGWWNRGVHEKSLSTYCFLVRCSIPEHLLGLDRVSSWQVNINKMLRSIPFDSAGDNMIVYFDTIDSKLAKCYCSKYSVLSVTAGM